MLTAVLPAAEDEGIATHMKLLKKKKMKLCV